MDYNSLGLDHMSRSAFSNQFRQSMTDAFAILPLIRHYTDDEQHKYCDSMQLSFYKILRNINNIECAMKISENAYTKTVFDLSKMIDNIRYTLDVACEIPVGGVTEKPHINLLGNMDLLSNGILGAIRNSFQYTRDGNMVLINLFTKRNNAVLEIQDLGLGIRAEYQERVFDPFFSVDPYGDNPVTPGLGLGLSLLKATVSQIDGSILVQSKFGQGTKLVISLPLSDGNVDDVTEDITLDYFANTFSPVYVQLCDYVKCFIH